LPISKALHPPPCTKKIYCLTRGIAIHMGPKKTNIHECTSLDGWWLDWVMFFIKGFCRNPSLGLTTKAKVYKSAGQEKDSRVRESVRMNTHTPKWTLILGVRIPVDFWIFRERFQRSKPISFKSSLYHWKSIET
jgi:hypothetical protein